MDKNKERINVSFDQLIENAKKENWDFVDENISEAHLTRDKIEWALREGFHESDQNIRDLAATLLNRSTENLSPEEMQGVESIMLQDSYHIVRYRLAIALHKRGYKTPAVEKMLAEATNDPDVGELAQELL